jgi:undecaprenyl-diphosphatase
MLAATAYSLFKARAELSADGAGLIALGFAAAFVVAFLVVRWLIGVVGRIGFAPFGWYRIVLGAVMLVWLALR